MTRGECAVGRFWGQSVLYVPRDIASHVGEKTIFALAIKLFGKQRLEEFGCSKSSTPAYYCIELPSVLTVGTESHHPDLMDTLVEKIMSLYQKK